MIKFTPNIIPLEKQQDTPGIDSREARKLKLKKATEAFESLFISQMLKNMRSASLKSDEEDGFGKDVMLSMADEGVAKHLAKSGMIGVGEVLYEHLLERLELEDTNSEQPFDELRSSLRFPRVHYERPDATAVGKGTESWRTEYSEAITAAARKHDLKPELLEAVIQAESGGDPLAISRKGAIGLMQLMPDTAQELGVKQPLDPNQNIAGGALYLRRLLDRFDDLKLALAAYNAGPGSVERHGGIPPYRETQIYVNKVISELEGDISGND